MGKPYISIFTLPLIMARNKTSQEAEGGERDPKIQCPGCKNKFEPSTDILVYTKGESVGINCPVCKGMRQLPRGEAEKARDFLKRRGITPKIQKEMKNLFEEEEVFDPKAIVLDIIDQIPSSALPGKLKNELKQFIETRPAPLTPGELYDLLKNRLSITEKISRMAYNRYIMALEINKQRSEQARALLDLVAPIYPSPFYQMPQSPQSPSYGYPAPYPNIGTPPYSPYPQPNIGTAGPPLPYQHPVGTGTTYPAHPQQIQQQPVVRQRQEEDVEVVEEILDEGGNVKKRIIKSQGSKKSGELEVLDRLIQLGILKPQKEETKDTIQEIVKVLKNSGIIGQRQERATSVAAQIAAQESNRVKELEKKIDQLNEELRKKEVEKLSIQLEELKQRLEEERHRYREELKKLEKDFERKSPVGKPESVQEMEVRKEMVESLSSQFSKASTEILNTVISPLIDVIRYQNLQTLMAMEQSGRLPPGTVDRMLSQKKATKQDVEKAKQRLSKLRKG